MSQIVLKENNQKRFQSIFAFAVILSLAGSFILGTTLINTPKSCIIIPVSPFKGGDIFGALSGICLFDFLMIWIISIPLCNSLRVIVSSSVCFWRGIIMGCAFKVSTENSLSAVAMIIILSYVAVTVVSVVYDAILNGTGDKSNLCRTVSCLVVSGGCAVIRIIPMLLIK